VAQFATSVVTANLSTTKVVKLLGARKDTKSTLGGRTVMMSGSKFEPCSVGVSECRASSVGAVSGQCRARVGAVSGQCRGSVG
jgi:hypothetical protein